jgi:hypothetical protein
MAPLETVAMKAVTGAGAPWYTSGVHMWNGTTASLNPMPTTNIPKPVNSSTSRTLPGAVANDARRASSMVPDWA